MKLTLWPCGPQTLGAKSAADLDKDLMSEDGGFSIDQLMELAGLSVAEAGQ
jgi:NAD(P)H-hydrate epimerase